MAIALGDVRRLAEPGAGARSAIAALLASPSEATLQAAREAWKAARVPYMQTEGFRFGNADRRRLGGRVNSWPLDEGLIDYVDPSYGEATDENPLYTANVIANPQLRIGGGDGRRQRRSPRNCWPASCRRRGDVETNVATGYHAIEFLLWGQDLNGTGPGAGNRPWTDYAQGDDCTHGNCDRRAAYLEAATELLVDDLTEMAADWAAGRRGAHGAGRRRRRDAGLADDPDRHRQPVLRRAGRRADEARPDAARPGGGA